MLFSVTIKDCDVQTFHVGGAGGGGKDTCSSGVRIVHRASGASGRAVDSRSQRKNKELAWKRMAESKAFIAWHKIECARRMGQESELNRILDDLLLDKNIKVEYY